MVDGLRRILFAFQCAIAFGGIMAPPVLAQSADRSLPSDAADGAPTRKELFKDSRGEIALARVRGEQNIGMLMVATSGKLVDLVAEVERLGGEIRYRADDVEYLRASVPIDEIDRLLALGGLQVADIVPIEFSARPIMQAASPGAPAPQSEQWPPPISDYPLREPYSALDDLDARDWIGGTPTFDGRGVTLAIVESPIDLLLPELQTATALDGKPVRKIIEHYTVVDPAEQAGYVQPWVNMQATVRAVRSAFNWSGKRYIAPGNGAFRIGLLDERTGAALGPKDFNLDGNPPDRDPIFGVLWDERTGSVWVDTDQDRDFSDERALKDYHLSQDIGIFGRDDPNTPRRETIGFSVQIHEQEKFVAINMADVLGFSDHATAVAGVALANASGDPQGRIDGTAPGARLISIHTGMTAQGQIEGLISAFRDPRVDLVVLETNITHSYFYLPNDGRRVEDVVVDRLLKRYPKTYIVPANNFPGLNQVTTAGTEREIGVGMYISAANLAALYGLHTPRADNLHAFGAFGPAGDGALQPTFVAPTNVISLAPGFGHPQGVKNLFSLPPGYRVCSGSSCAAPLAAGAVARLISGAKQRELNYDPPRLRGALRAGARFLPGIDAYKQGHGLIQLQAAWEELERVQGTDGAAHEVTISSQAPVKTVTSNWLETPNQGVGLYEREGWRPGDRGQRKITLTRTSGPAGPLRFKVQWLGNDMGVFSSPAEITLPLNQPVALVVDIFAKNEGVHSALLTLTSDALAGYVWRTLCTVVAGDPLGEADGGAITKPLQWTMPDTASAYFDVPDGTAALALRIDGAPGAYLQSPDRSAPGGWASMAVLENRRVIEHPHPGVWEVVLSSPDLSTIERTGRAIDPSSAAVTASIYRVDVNVEPAAQPNAAGGASRSWTVRMKNRGASFTGGATASPLGSRFKTRGSLAKHEQQLYVIEVPAGASRLEVAVVSPGGGSDVDLDLYLFNCSKDPCASARSAIGRRSSERLFVDNPTAGRWVAVVDAARMDEQAAQFEYSDIVFAPALGAISVTDPAASRAVNDSWIASAHAWVASPPPKGREIYGRIGVTAPKLLTDARSPNPFHYLDTDGLIQSPAILGSAEVNWGPQ